MTNSTDLGGLRSAFPSTSWSLIRAVQREPSPDRRAKLEQLIALYWKPIYCYIKASWRKGNEDAKDLTQEFFTMLLEGNTFERLAEEHGTFRGYIKTALSHFLVSQERSSSALKRGGASARVSLDLPALQDVLVDASSASPEEIFDREWIAAALAGAMKELERVLLAEKRDRCFQIFKEYYLDSENSPDGGERNAQGRIEPEERRTYEQLAEKFGIPSHEVRSNLSYARHRLRSLLEEYARDHSLSEEDARQEIRFLVGE